MVAETSNQYLEETKGRPKRWTKNVCDNLADELNTWILNEENLFLIEFAIKHKFNRQDFPVIIKESELFSDAYLNAKMILEARLSKCALTGKHKEHFTKFLMMNLHGYVDRSESKVTSEGKVNVSITTYGMSNSISDTGISDSLTSDKAREEIDITPTFGSIEHKQEQETDKQQNKQQT